VSPLKQIKLAVLASLFLAPVLACMATCTPKILQNEQHTVERKIFSCEFSEGMSLPVGKVITINDERVYYFRVIYTQKRGQRDD